MISIYTYKCIYINIDIYTVDNKLIPSKAYYFLHRIP